MLSRWARRYSIGRAPAEDAVWNADVRDILGELPDNFMAIWHYGFTKMLNNAIDHSGGCSIEVRVAATAAGAEMSIGDNGFGLFGKVCDALGLLDERHTMLELSKGMLSTDTDRHASDGVFFTCRLFERFRIVSGANCYTHEPPEESAEFGDWLLRTDAVPEGTTVFMNLRSRASGALKAVFEEFMPGDDGALRKTVAPVRLARCGRAPPLSRSQAKRLLGRLELFETVLLDFPGVDTIGPAFADEVFRVFALHHSDTELMLVHAGPQARKMIRRARRALATHPGDPAPAAAMIAEDS